jgi:membrane protease YdiL (CAAX protease family)
VGVNAVARPGVEPARSNARLVGWLSYVGLFSLLAYTSRFAGGEESTVEEPLYRTSTAVLGAVQFGIMLAIILLLCVGASRRELLALRRPTSWWRTLGIAVAVYILVFVVGAIVGQFVDPAEEQGLLPEIWDPDRAGALALNAILVVVAAPIVEELTFRGIGFTLLERFGRWFAIVGTAVAFGLAHGLVEAFPLLAAFGLGLGYMRARVDSVYPCILLHGAFNGLTLAFALATAERVQ